MNLLLLTEADRLEGDRFRLDDARARHVREILGAEPGKALRVGLLEGPVGRGVVASAPAGELHLDCRFDGPIPPRPKTDLLLALPRPKSLKKLLPEVTALGVDQLVLLRTWRVAQPYLTQALLRPEQQRPLLLEGMMQAKTTRMPEISFEREFRPFVEDRAAARWAGATKLVAHPEANEELASVRLGPEERVALVVGPEGGLVDFELELLEAAGFRRVSLGPRVLRVETACVALLAQLDLLRRLSEDR